MQGGEADEVRVCSKRAVGRDKARDWLRLRQLGLARFAAKTPPANRTWPTSLKRLTWFGRLSVCFPPSLLPFPPPLPRPAQPSSSALASEISTLYTCYPTPYPLYTRATSVVRYVRIHSCGRHRRALFLRRVSPPHSKPPPSSLHILSRILILSWVLFVAPSIVFKTLSSLKHTWRAFAPLSSISAHRRPPLGLSWSPPSPRPNVAIISADHRTAPVMRPPRCRSTAPVALAADSSDVGLARFGPRLASPFPRRAKPFPSHR